MKEGSLDVHMETGWRGKAAYGGSGSSMFCFFALLTGRIDIPIVIMGYVDWWFCNPDYNRFVGRLKGNLLGGNVFTFSLPVPCWLGCEMLVNYQAESQ